MSESIELRGEVGVTVGGGSGGVVMDCDGGDGVVMDCGGGGGVGGSGGTVMDCMAVFQEYITHILPHNAAWSSDPPAWCSDITISNEKFLANTKKWAEGRCWGQEGGLSTPVQVTTNDTYGRHLIATRDLRAGEVVLLEPPLILAVREKSASYCSTCFKRAQSFSCDECGFFFCNADCITAEHRVECALLCRLGLSISSRRNSQQDNNLFKDRIIAMPSEQRAQAEALLQQAQSASEHQRRLEVLRHYVMVAALRTLVAMEHNPLTKRLIFALQGNINRNLYRYRVNQKKIVDVLVQRLQATSDPELVHRVCSVWDINGFDVPLSWGTRVHGLYPLASLLTHDCRSNTQQWFTGEGHLVLRVVQDIPSGTLLTTCYTDPQWSTILRQDHLRVSKQFTCTCERCQDPTELGTFLGSPLCTGCHAPLVSCQPLDSAAVWICHGGCPHTATAKEIMGLGAKIGRSVGGVDGKDAASLNSLADYLKVHLHSSHHVLLRLHTSTLNTLVSKDLKQLSEDELETVRSLASLVTATISRLEAPLTRLSVRVGREEVRLELERLRRDGVKGPPANDVLQKLSRQVSECQLVLGWDDRMPPFTDVLQDYQALVDGTVTAMNT